MKIISDKNGVTIKTATSTRTMTHEQYKKHCADETFLAETPERLLARDTIRTKENTDEKQTFDLEALPHEIPTAAEAVLMNEPVKVSMLERALKYIA